MAPESRRGRYFGFGNLAGSIGFAIGPLFGGVLKDSMGENVPAMWLVIASVFIISMAGFILLGKIVPRKANQPSKEEVTAIEIAKNAA
jgi:MFS family permease